MLGERSHEAESFSSSTPVKISKEKKLNEKNSSFRFHYNTESISNQQKPIQIAAIDKKKKLQMNTDALSSVLLQDKVRDKPLVIISIAGDFRKGKSFLLNFFLRYLNRKGSENWIGLSEEPLTGFKWRAGSDRETTGIWMWSQPFLYSIEENTEVAIILMDTQGTFDSEYTFSDNAKIFSLSTLISSVFIFNLFHNLQEDNLNVLDIFSDYGRLAVEEIKEKPFQKLIFLIRDWPYPSEYPYGEYGGRKFLTEKFERINNKPEQIKKVRKRICFCFEEIACFLMPYPGNIVATNVHYDGRLSAMDAEFVESLKEFVEFVFKPEHLIIKRIGGQIITGLRLLEHLKAYVKVFQEDKMPEPKTMLEATAEANNLAALVEAKHYYFKKMEALCGINKPFIYPSVLEKKQAEILKEARTLFAKTKKLGGEEFSTIYFRKLDQEIEEIREYFVENNKSKSFYCILGTIGTLFFAGLFYLFANPNIEQIIEICDRTQKPHIIVSLLKELIKTNEKVLIFAETKTKFDFLSRLLRGQRYLATGLHGDKTQLQRDMIMEDIYSRNFPLENSNY
ncbi:atlastin-1-like protein [Dinothrombium tinctorium]|uniref:Atlastin-1-like protein n=1 Tax=Dinothrombium tinctorium TaxID=1965070 RepID=A0A3S3P773_9ACAR|nr:atlastin-1-like protein [Dinothrombium tinctorium]RWS06704.1 atlastin-1-like protein [Dinothrombium tinctorium]